MAPVQIESSPFRINNLVKVGTDMVYFVGAGPGCLLI